MSKFDTIMAEELSKLMDGLRAQIKDPVERVAIMAMVADAAMLPVRMARGEDVSNIVRSLKAEAANRTLAQRTRAETLLQQAWLGILGRVLAGVLMP